MITKKPKSQAVRFLEKLNKGALTIGQAIGAARICDEMTLSEFAEKLHISTSHLCDIEKGRKIVSPARAAKFAHILGHSEKLWVKLALQQELDQAGIKLRVYVEAA